MVNLLIVSHSARLAEGVMEFVAQVSQQSITVLAAGGTAEGALGTSVDRIIEALQTLDSPDGTLVLVDIGGAVISVETAMELAETSGPVRISNAPLVEGAYLAAIEAASGATLEETATAALQGRELVKVHDP